MRGGELPSPRPAQQHNSQNIKSVKFVGRRLVAGTVVRGPTTPAKYRHLVASRFSLFRSPYNDISASLQRLLTETGVAVWPVVGCADRVIGDRTRSAAGRQTTAAAVWRGGNRSGIDCGREETPGRHLVGRGAHLLLSLARAYYIWPEVTSKNFSIVSFEYARTSRLAAS